MASFSLIRPRGSRAGHRYGRLLRYVFRQWPVLALILVLTGLCSAVAALQPWPMKILVDYALGHRGVPAGLVAALQALSLPSTAAVLVGASAAASLAIFAIGGLLDAVLAWAWTLGGQRMVIDLSADLFHRLQRLSLLYHSRRTVGDALSRLTGDTWCVYTLSSSLLVSPVQQVLTLATIGWVAWSLDARLTIAAMTAAPVLGASAFFFGRRMRRRATMDREAQSRLLSFVQQTLSSLPVVQAFGTERRNLGIFQGLASDAVHQSQRGVFLNQAFGGVNGMATTVGTALVIALGGRQVLEGTLSVGTLLVFLAYLKTVQGATQSLLGTFTSLQSVGASVDRILEVLDADEEVRDRPGARSLGRAKGEVRLEDVEFGYEPGRPVLHGVSLEARPGEVVALIGTTGSGKSTLVSLIARFYDPWSGRVLIDGADARDLKLADLRAQVSLVLQEPFLLPLSVAENIAYARPGATREEIERVARIANAHEFIERLPQGYETLLGERGSTLSGGQRQRLSIARALLKDAPILVLDEPTSALDPATEAQLVEALQRLMLGRTTFIIAHRLTTIRHADRIAVLEQGRVVEVGTHDDLVARNGRYRRLHALQGDSESLAELEPELEVVG